MNLIASSAWSVLRKWLPTARLQHLAHQVAHGADHRDHLRRLGVGHVDLHLQVDLEDEALAALADDRRQLRVEVVRLRGRVGPVERQDERGTISAAYTRGLIAYLPVRNGSCQMPR